MWGNPQGTVATVCRKEQWRMPDAESIFASSLDVRGLKVKTSRNLEGG